MRYPAFAFTLVAIAGVTLASACGQPFPPTGTLFRITNDGPRIRERPSAISDRFAVFEGNADSIKVYDRYSRVTSEIAREFQIGVDASNTHVAWQTPYGGTVYFLKVWEKATGRVSLIDTERGHTFGRRDFIGDRLVYSNLLNDYIRIWDPDTDTVEELVPECNFDYWDATPAFVAWTCPFEGLVVLYDLANDSVTEITSPPEYNRPRRIELADEWVVWGVERGYVLAAPLEGGPIRTIAAGLHYYDRDDFNAAGRFAAWWRSGQIQLHDLHADTTTTVG